MHLLATWLTPLVEAVLFRTSCRLRQRIRRPQRSACGENVANKHFICCIQSSGKTRPTHNSVLADMLKLESRFIAEPHRKADVHTVPNMMVGWRAEEFTQTWGWHAKHHRTQDLWPWRRQTWHHVEKERRTNSTNTLKPFRFTVVGTSNNPSVGNLSVQLLQSSMLWFLLRPELVRGVMQVQWWKRQASSGWLSPTGERRLNDALMALSDATLKGRIKTRAGTIRSRSAQRDTFSRHAAALTSARHNKSFRFLSLVVLHCALYCVATCSVKWWRVGLCDDLVSHKDLGGVSVSNTIN